MVDLPYISKLKAESLNCYTNIMKFIKFTLVFFIIFGISGALNAQVINTDSVKKIAQKDVLKFKLDKTDLKAFRANGRNPNSDLFKPTAKTTSNTSMLNDSLYVETFRKSAFKKTKRRKTIFHQVLIGGAVLALGAAIITVPIAASR